MVIGSHQDFKRGYAIKLNDELIYCATIEELTEIFTQLRSTHYPFQINSVRSMLVPSKIDKLPRWLAPILVVKTANVTYIGSEVE